MIENLIGMWVKRHAFEGLKEKFVLIYKVERTTRSKAFYWHSIYIKNIGYIYEVDSQSFLFDEDKKHVSPITIEDAKIIFETIPPELRITLLKTLDKDIYNVANEFVSEILKQTINV